MNDDNHIIKKVDIQLRLFLPQTEILVEKKYGVFIQFNADDKEGVLQYCDFSEDMKLQHIHKEPITEKAKQNTEAGNQLDSIYRLIWQEDTIICRMFQYYDIQQIFIYCDINSVNLVEGYIKAYVVNDDKKDVNIINIANNSLCKRVWVNPKYRKELSANHSSLVSGINNFNSVESLLSSAISNEWLRIRERAEFDIKENIESLLTPNDSDIETDSLNTRFQPQNLEVDNFVESQNEIQTTNTDSSSTIENSNSAIESQETYPIQPLKNRELITVENDKVLVLSTISNFILLVGVIAICVKLYFM